MARISRRTVYVATIVAMFAMIGGFGLAWSVTGYTTYYNGTAGTGTTNYNQMTTQWTSTQPTDVATSAASCTTSAVTAGTIGSPQTATVGVASGCAASDDGVQFVYTAPTGAVCPSSGGSDTFTWSFAVSGGTPASGNGVLTVNCPSPGGPQSGGLGLTLTVDLDQTGNLAGVAVSVVVSGNY